MPLVDEILDRLVVQEAIDRARIGLAILGVHLAAEFEPPLCRRRRIGDVRHDDSHRDGRKGEIEVVPYHGADERHLDEHRQDAEQEIGQKELDGVCAALDRARQPARLPFEVEAQGQAVDVLQHADGDEPQSALFDFGEKQIA